MSGCNQDPIDVAFRLRDALEAMAARGVCSLVYSKRFGWSCAAREFGVASRGATPTEAAEKALDRALRGTED